MSDCSILSWQPLLRPPLPAEDPAIDTEALNIPLRALSCRNQRVSVAALVICDRPICCASLKFTDLTCGNDTIPAGSVRALLAGPVPTPEAGAVMDPLYDLSEFEVDRCASFYISIDVPKGIAAGTYQGTVTLVAAGSELASHAIEVEVADVDLPDQPNWSFFLNVWMNPATIARWHGVEMWSDQHFELMRPYVEDLASHGQQTVVVPVCYRPWGTQTRDPFPSAVIWQRRGSEWEFDFSIFDRFVKLHEECGIDRAIHCYSIVSGPGQTGESTIEYIDLETGTTELMLTTVGDRDYVDAWRAFLAAFEHHLRHKGWLEKTYLAFDEKPPEVMQNLFRFLDKYGQAFKISLAGNTSDELVTRFDDLSLHIGFNDRGVDTAAPPERSAMGVAQLLDPEPCPIEGACPDKSITTYYVCCGPAFPNTFLFSPLVESRMLPFLSVQGGYDGFLRWSYNDWTDDPYTSPEWGSWPTGDVFFVYPGPKGPVTSLRWEQLREGIYDYELAMIASGNIQTPDEMVDYEQAIALACRNTDGRKKSVGDIELARRLLIPIAEHAKE